MKKYLLGFAAVVFAVAFSAFTKPEGANRITYYSFEYLAPGSSYAAADVSSLAATSWGNAIVAPLGALQLGCDQTATTEKACEIIVAEAQTIVDNGVRRLKTVGEGSTITITTVDGDASNHTGVFMVNKATSSNLFNADNKRF
jgi:hypothetical protein